MKDIRLRQIHLDFHTSESIPDIGKDFDPNKFAETLKQAHVNSITCFSRCHHGWLYYPSKLFPQKIHPNLKYKNLLGDQIEACHKYGIKVPVYLPIQWDNLVATEHPEWLVMDENGRPVGTGPYEAGFYKLLCLNSPYKDFLIKQAIEVLQMYPVDGLFLDIVNVKECSCAHCKKGMIEAGLNPSLKDDRKKYTLDVIKEFTHEVSSELRKIKPDIELYYNHAHVRTSHRDIIDGFTHLELESLPSGGWGYMDFPITVRYARTLGVPILGQTGKFHTSWGDFHSLRNNNALEYECFRSLALDAGCSIGDQLHPYGKLDEAAYKLIGKVYSSVEEKEPWCYGAEPVVEIGVVSPDGFWGDNTGYFSAEIEGVSRLLTECGFQFNVIDQKENLSKYKLIILPDVVKLTPEFSKELKQYLSRGGKLISTYKSLQNTNEDWGFKPKGEAPFCPDFLVPGSCIHEGLENVEYVMYEKGECVELTDGEVIASVHEPFFNRTWEHYCSHQHAPSTFTGGYPCVVKNAGHIHFIHPMFHTYAMKHPHWYKVLIKNAIHMLIGSQLIEHNGPSFLLVTLNHQEKDKRYVLHALGYFAERSAREFDIVEDKIDIQNIEFTLSIDKEIKSAKIIPERIEISIYKEGNKQKIMVPSIYGHCMIELDY